MSFEKRNLRILFSHYGIKDGDGFGRTFMLARELAALGHYVTILTSQRGEFTFPLKSEARDGVEIVSFPDVVPKAMRKGGLGPLNILLKSVYVLLHQYDIVHSDSGHRPSSGIPCTVHRFFRNSIYVSEWWDYFGKGGMQDDQQWWYRAILGTYDSWAEIHNKKIADGVIALSEFTKGRAIDIGVPEERILILHGGADTRTIQYIPDRRNRKKFGIPEDSLVFGFVGINEHELIDLEPFLRAVNSLKNFKRISWFSTGRKLSKETTGKFGLSDEYHEFGWVDYEQYSDLLSCADVFALLSRQNLVNKARWPNKVGDYLAAGRVVLANPYGEVAHYMRESPESFISVSWSHQSIENAILEMLDNRDEILKKGEHARRLAEERLSWKIQALSLDSFYHLIVGNEGLLHD